MIHRDSSAWNIGDGWVAIVERALNEIEGVTDTLEISVIKNLHGSLHMFFYDPDDANLTTPEQFSKVWEIVDNAIALSEKTCDVCGLDRGRLFEYGNTFVTRCDAHKP